MKAMHPVFESIVIGIDIDIDIDILYVINPGNDTYASSQIYGAMCMPISRAAAPMALLLCQYTGCNHWLTRALMQN